MTHHKPSI